jgi:hypothetical protein
MDSDPPSYFTLSTIAGKMGIHHHTHLFSEMGSHELFCLGWPGTTVLPILASHVPWDARYATMPSYVETRSLDLPAQVGLKLLF